MSEWPWTPGPWTTDISAAAEGGNWAAECGVSRQSPKVWTNHEIDDAGEEANAALIALAPEMAEAIEGLCACYDVGGEDLDDMDAWQRVHDVRAKLRAIGEEDALRQIAELSEELDL